MQLDLIAAILNKESKLDVVDALLLALIGIAIVFIVLIALMLIVTLVGKIFDSSDAMKQKHPEWGDKIANFKAKLAFWKKSTPEEEEEVTPVDAPLAKGSCGELTLVNTSDRDAAMIMAIVADETNTPLNELRFKSIKRVDDKNMEEEK